MDQTSIGIGRDPQGLQQIARATGVHVVMCTSYYTHEYHPPHVSTLNVIELCDRIVRDIDEGVAGGIQAGIIGEVGLSHPLHPDEEKVLTRILHEGSGICSVAGNTVWSIVQISIAIAMVFEGSTEM